MIAKWVTAALGGAILELCVEVGGTITGERLVNFDLNVVAPYNSLPISYNRGTNTCVLVCHGVSHTNTGQVQGLNVRSGLGIKK